MNIKVEKKMYFVSSPKLMTYNVSTKSVALFNEKTMSLELTASKLLLMIKQYKHSKCI